VGVRRILIGAAFACGVIGQGFAADLPPPALPPRAPATYVPAVAPVYNWSGVYLGVNGGFAFANTWFNDPAVWTGNGPFSMDGWQAGGTLGANYQWGHFVAGIEGDGDWTKQNGTLGQSFWLATARGRAGYAIDRILFYGTGGVAVIDRGVRAGGGLPEAIGTEAGWVVGVGVEWAFLENWTGKFEYFHVEPSAQSCPATSCVIPSSVPLEEDILRAGFNYKFAF
jgi:outer membrane immunogenic protein